ncbi:MAG: voltage-gated potassium channel protein [Burkholderiaceae bacterium]
MLLHPTLRKLHAIFPLHWLLAVLVAVNGFVLLQPGIYAVNALEPASWRHWITPDSLNAFLESMGLIEVPRLMLGAGLQIMAVGLIFRARIAWTFSLLMLIGAGTFFWWRTGSHSGLVLYTFMLVALLLVYWRRFDRSSLIAGSLFAVISVASLLIYAVFGSLYLGNEFAPPITDGTTAFYFSIVSMSTVGFGDITPQTHAARLFTTSVIILGITVFATSISAVAGPIMGGNLKRLVSGRINKTMRKNHIIIAGVTPLAQNVYHALRAEGDEVTVIIPADTPSPYPENADVLHGDATESELLEKAGAPRARYILALRADDAENAFIVLAAREVKGTETKTVALVNNTMHLNKIRQVAPDVVFSLQSLGAEILARTVSGQPIDDTLITRLLFPDAKPSTAGPA